MQFDLLISADNVIPSTSQLFHQRILMLVTSLVASPANLCSDAHGRLFAAVPGEGGGLFVIEGSEEPRRLVAGDVSGVVASRDGKLFLARGDEVLQVDLDSAWVVSEVSDDFGVAAGKSSRAVAGCRHGSVWIDGCTHYRGADGSFVPRPPGPDGGAGGVGTPLPQTFDLYGNHWALASGAVVLRPANEPETWQRVEPQPEGGGWRLLAADANGLVWASGNSGDGLCCLDPRRSEEGWRVPTGVEAWTGRVTALTRAADDTGRFVGFDDGSLIEAGVESRTALVSRTVAVVDGGAPIDLLHVDPLGGIWIVAGAAIHRLEAAESAWQNAWESVAPLPGCNHDIFGVELGGAIYVAGGLASGWGYPAVDRVFSELFCYDPQTRAWGIAGEMPSARCHNGLTVCEGEVWVVGGRANLDDPHRGQDLVPLDEVIAFDPRSGQWRSAPSLNTPRTEPVALVARGRVYAIGGADSEGNSLSSVESIGPGEGTWRFEAETPRPIRQFAGCALDGILYVLGREGAFAYDPAHGEWDELPAPERLLPASFVAAYEGEVWALGDYEVRQSWRYSPPERRWRPGPELPSPESWGGAAVLDGRLHVIGGAHWSPALDTHVWDARVFTLRPGWSRGSD